MNLFIIILLTSALLVITLAIVIPLISHEQEKNNPGLYTYRAKKHLMTPREEDCFRILNRIFDKKYYIIPQVHLSTLFDHEVPGQNYKGAFFHINGKSVDFVLVNKETLRPICAIEIDDYSHNSFNRYKRDIEVERIFKEANLALIRSREFLNLSDRQIFEKVKRAIERTKAEPSSTNEQ